MRRQAFLAFAHARGATLENRVALQHRLCGQLSDFRTAFSCPEMFVLNRDGPVLALEGRRGLILGTLYPAAAKDMNEASDFSAKVVESRGRALISARWGNYIAFMLPDGLLNIIRAPFGDLPCYIIEGADGTFLASDLTTLVRARAIVTRPDWTGVTQFLLAEDICHSKTCVDGVTELLGGQRFERKSNGHQIVDLWTPWDYVEPGPTHLNHASAAASLRDLIVATVAEVMELRGTALLRLSGGLDSSILASAVHATGHPVVALNLVTDNPAGDERAFARSVAQRLGITMVERWRSANDVDLAQSDARSEPRPIARSFTQSSARISSAVAADFAADIVIDGGGGDQLFCSLRTARIAADCLARGPRRGNFWSTTAAVARLAPTSMFEVARRAWSIHRRHSPRFNYPIDRRFLAVGLEIEAQSATAHPWLNAPSNALPGKAAHVAMLVQAQGIVAGASVNSRLPLLSPLMSQPIVEACLRIPTWLWVKGGRDRAIAREAFAPMLPSDVLGRLSKGSPDPLVIDLFESNRSIVRSMLLDGQLASKGLLDRASLKRAIDLPGPVSGVDFYRIMRLVDVEAWLGSF